MEDYQNKVANLHANQSQNISKLPANYTRSEPLELRGAMGGAYPPYAGSPPRGCISLPKEGQLAAPDTQWVLAQGPNGHPLGGGGEHTLERLCWGVSPLLSP